MRRCSKCSFSTLEDKHICPECGAPLQEVPIASALDEEQLLKKLRRQVYRLFLGELSVVGIVSILGLGFGLWKAYNGAVSKLQRVVIERVTAQFQEPNIQNTVQHVAGNEAAKIISQNLEPAARKVDDRLQKFEKFLDDRRAEYDADLAAFRKELGVLTKRNELTRMADRAIANGSLADYERLLKMLHEEVDEDLKAAESAEVFRVVSAFSIFSPSRAAAANFDVPLINPQKKNENELTDDEILEVLIHDQAPLDRAHAAVLLKKRTMTFQMAQALRDAIDGETNLEALRFEKAAFGRISGFEGDGTINGKHEVEWFDKNVDRLRKELPK